MGPWDPQSCKCHPDSHWILWKGPTFQCMDNIDMRLLKMHIYTNYIHIYTYNIDVDVDIDI